MKKFSLVFAVAVMAAAVVACTSRKVSPEELPLVPALEDAAWSASQWISAADAPVSKGPAQECYTSAPGASWFLSAVKNGKKVKKAVWMTAGLGVCERQADRPGSAETRFHACPQDQAFLYL